MIHTTDTDHAIIVSFSGVDELGAPEEPCDVMNILQESRARAMNEQKRLIIDLQGIRSISTMSVGHLLVIASKDRKQSGEPAITLARVGEELRQRLFVLRLQAMFRFENDLDSGPDTIGAPVPRPSSPDGDSASAAPPFADGES